MCLKKYVEFTFSNKEAWNRLTQILEQDYSDRIHDGEVILIQKYRDWGNKIVLPNRNNLTYEHMVEYRDDFYPPFYSYHYEWFGWIEYFRIKEYLENEQDIFGKVRIELQ